VIAARAREGVHLFNEVHHLSGGLRAACGRRSSTPDRSTGSSRTMPVASDPRLPHPPGGRGLHRVQRLHERQELPGADRAPGVACARSRAGRISNRTGLFRPCRWWRCGPAPPASPVRVQSGAVALVEQVGRLTVRVTKYCARVGMSF
jgi:hypothetical protein